MSGTKAMKIQAWLLLILSSAMLGMWTKNVFAGLFLLVFVLLIGTVITGFYLWTRKE